MSSRNPIDLGQSRLRSPGSPSLCAMSGLAVLSLFCLACQRDSTLSEEANRAARAAATAVDGAALQAHVSALLTARQSEAPVPSPYFGAMPLRRSQAADYIDRALRAEGYTPIHERDEQNGVATDNIYVDIAGSAQPASYVLVTGHYDNWHLGADDNASAVAVLLQAAHIFVGQRPRRSLRIVAFDREEEGLTGSERFAERHAADSIYAVLNMDCVAFASHEENSQSAPPGLGLRSIGDFLAVLANVPAASPLSQVAALSSRLPQPVDVLGLLAPGDGHNAGAAAFLRSDHAPFWRRGVPALFFTDTANFRNPNYHKKSDLPDTLDYDFLSRSGQLVIAAAAALAEEP